ncbi:MAG: efflux RND transporter permease subunit, partial [Spirosomaceae bacterium]|nr:efflux RND transporter permease subunit [Spirosomataceae bacterium]
PIVAEKPTTQADVDSIKNKIAQFPFYKGFVYSEEGDAHLMAITLKQADLNSKRRLSISGEIQEIADEFGKAANVDIHYSGMPYIRTNFMSKVRDELIMFMLLAFLTTTAILYLFFRSFRVVFFAVLVVLTAVIWSVGFIHLGGYKITILTGMIPPLIMIIGIPNTIFIINKYQEEFLKGKSQLEALGTSIEKIGKTTFIANITTFIGFFVFYFTGSPFLVEFGLVAAASVLATWAISLILIPTIFSYNREPNAKHVRHLENPRITQFLEYVNFIVHNQRTKLY